MSLRIGIGKLRLTPSITPIDPAIPIINDGNTVIWLDHLTGVVPYLPPNQAYLHFWNDQSTAGHNMAATMAAPTIEADGILFNGTTMYVDPLNFTWNQPALIYAVLKQITWTSGDNFWAGNAATKGRLSQTTGTPKISLYSGAFGSDNANMPLDTFCIVRALYSGAASSLQVNLTAPVVSNAGANNLDGFILGCRAAGSGHAHIKVKAIIGRKINDAAGDQTLIYNYLKTRYGL